MHTLLITFHFFQIVIQHDFKELKTIIKDIFTTAFKQMRICHNVFVFLPSFFQIYENHHQSLSNPEPQDQCTIKNSQISL